MARDGGRRRPPCLAPMVGSDPADRADQEQRDERAPRLHGISRRRRAQGRAHRRRAATGCSATAPRPIGWRGSRDRGHEKKQGRRDRRSGEHPDPGPVRRHRVRGAAVRVQGRPEQVPRGARSRVAGAFARGRHRLQQCTQGAGTAVLRTGDHDPGGAERKTAHGPEVQKRRRSRKTFASRARSASTPS